ncbi:MAG TPA: chemotaxis response regulator protein-glutamate methylesterase [Candidatus Tenderia electrophaga]|uniref:Protein-glutamate methylesterase/protein-glutamine glutaminase n=1 Tax=Candidatus Tenderia electrophaga TaxID=1748243 RepID=A0A832N356_9GAMM|nr:chemotaxis response regulator protein-glutamate methylesterase [Candidatus Tenderia electrophaga]
MRIAIVNDSLMAVESLRRVVTSVPDYEVVWVAHDGAEAVWRCGADVPDLILMDLIMPVMDGVDATRKIMEFSPCSILIVTSTVSGNASKVFQAMGYGALDAVNTPVLGMTGDAEGKDEFLQKVSMIGKLINQHSNTEPPKVATIGSMVTATSGRLVAIGSSSGGPKALSVVLQSLPADFSAPIVIVQHVDQKFTAELAAWLDKQCALEVRLAKKGDRLVPGRVLIAGTNDHLILNSRNSLEYTPDPVDEAYRPSVDVFFSSVAKHWAGEVVAVLLTGMGRDGAEGLLTLKNKGVYTIAQDEASCAVYGMPKAAVQIGAAQQILPIDDIASELIEFFNNGKKGSRRNEC